jgi:AbiV family abortive infection protein
MYSKGSEECLNNAKKLLDASRILLNSKNFGTAQSLSIIALEEVGKAIILELANLNYVDGEVVKKAMREHITKQTLVSLIEKGMIYHEFYVRKAGDYAIDKGKLDELKKLMQSETKLLDRKRKDGLYVQVNSDDGSIDTSPSNTNEPDAQNIVGYTDSFSKLGKVLCELFRELKMGTVDFANNLKISKDFQGLTFAWDEV